MESLTHGLTCPITASITKVSVDHERFLAPEPSSEYRPLCWWRKIKNALGLNGLRLAQGNLFEILYLENSKLLSQAHYAGPDVQMLRKIVQYVINTFEDSPLPGKIDKYFPVIDLDLINDDYDDEPENNGDEVDDSEAELDENKDVSMMTINQYLKESVPRGLS